MKSEKINLFLVDDDALFLKLLEIEFLKHADFLIECFATGESCVDNLFLNPDVVILDYHLDNFNKTALTGIETMDKIKLYDPNILIIILSAQDKIDVAVECMQHNAFDYVVKDETAFLRLQKIISNIFEYQKMEKELKWYLDTN